MKERIKGAFYKKNPDVFRVGDRTACSNSVLKCVLHPKMAKNLQ